MKALRYKYDAEKYLSPEALHVFRLARAANPKRPRKFLRWILGENER